MPSPATPPAVNLTAEALDLPGQFEEVTREAYRWVRHDSLNAGIALAEALALYAVFFGIRFVLRRVVGNGHPITTFRGFAERILGKTRSFFLAALSAWLVTHLVAPPGAINGAIDIVFTIAAIVQGAVWVRVIIIALIERQAVTEEDEATLASAMGIIKILLNVVIWTIALIVILDNIGVNVTALIAGLGVGGIAIGLAAQGIFADLFAAMSILLDRPFRVGDSISFGNPATTGTVEAIGLKTTRIRALSGEQVIVSNTNLLNQQIGNLKRIEERRVVLTLYLSLATPPAKLKAVPAMAQAAIKTFRQARFDRAHVANATLDAVEIEIVFHVTVADYAVLMDARQAVLLRLLERLEAEDIALAERVPPAPDQGAPPAPAQAAAG